MTTLPSIKLLLASIDLSLKVIASERIFPGLQELPLFWRFLRRMTYPRADLHLVQTKSVAQWLHHHRFASRTAVLPNAIPWPLYRHSPTIDPALLLDSCDKLVLAVGTSLFRKVLIAWCRPFPLQLQKNQVGSLLSQASLLMIGHPVGLLCPLVLRRLCF